MLISGASTGRPNVASSNVWTRSPPTPMYDTPKSPPALLDFTPRGSETTVSSLPSMTPIRSSKCASSDHAARSTATSDPADDLHVTIPGTAPNASIHSAICSPEQPPHLHRHRLPQLPMLLGLEVDAVEVAGDDHRAGIEEGGFLTRRC